MDHLSGSWQIQPCDAGSVYVSSIAIVKQGVIWGWGSLASVHVPADYSLWFTGNSLGENETGSTNAGKPCKDKWVQTLAISTQEDKQTYRFLPMSIS